MKIITILMLLAGLACAGPVVELTDQKGNSGTVELLSKTNTHVTVRFQGSGRVATLDRTKLSPLSHGLIANWRPGEEVAQKPNRATNRATVPITKPAPAPRPRVLGVRRTFSGCSGGVCR